MRAVVTVVVGMLVAGSLWSDDPPKPEGPKFPPGVPEFVPDSNWKPRKGDRAEIIADADGDAGEARIGLARGTRVEVVSYAPPERERRVYGSGLDFGRALQQSLLNPIRAPMAVRVLSGPAKGRECVVMDNEVGVMVANPCPWLPFKEGDVMAIWDASIPLATDVPSYQAIRRNPEKAASRLIAQHKAFRLKPGTEVEVIQAGIDETRLDGLEISRVRVRPGFLHAGRVGLIYRGNLARPGDARR